MSLLFDIGVPMVYECITMKQQNVYILDLSMNLTFDLYLDGRGILIDFYLHFYLV